MAFIQTRSSALALKLEVTEGVWERPTLATDFTALQPDFAMSPNTEVINSEELTGSIGAAKSFQGLETPTVSFSHYLRGSGVSGSPPDYNVLLHALFGIEKIGALGSARTINTGSTVSNFVVNDGTQFNVGEAMMVRNINSAYEVRAVHAISTNDITPSFNTNNAPEDGIELGQPITYTAADDGHPTYTTWYYVGGDGALEAVAGTRVVNGTFSITAGDLVNANYSQEGINFAFNPIFVDAGSDFLDFSDGTGTYALQVTTGLYETPDSLALTIQTGLNALSTDVYTVSWDKSIGGFNFTQDSGSGTFSILWNTGTNSANTIALTLGFDAGSDSTGATSYSSANPIDFSPPVTPTFDDSDPLVARDHQVMLGDDVDVACFRASELEISIDNTKTNIESVCSATGVDGSLITERAVSITFTAILEQYDTALWEKFRVNGDVRFQYTFGTKTDGTNWDIGKTGLFYSPNNSIATLEVVDVDGIARLSGELTAYVKEGQPDIYLSFV